MHQEISPRLNRESPRPARPAYPAWAAAARAPERPSATARKAQPAIISPYARLGRTHQPAEPPPHGKRANGGGGRAGAATARNACRRRAMRRLSRPLTEKLARCTGWRSRHSRSEARKRSRDCLLRAIPPVPLVSLFSVDRSDRDGPRPVEFVEQILAAGVVPRQAILSNQARRGTARLVWPRSEVPARRPSGRAPS